MSPRLARILIRLYAPCWQERFGQEFQTFLETRHVSAREAIVIAICGCLSHFDTPKRRLILVFSLCLGANWTALFFFGNLGDTALLGNFRTTHLHAYRTIGSSFLTAAVAFSAVAGFVAASKLARLGEALRVTAWSGYLGGSIAALTGMGIEVVFHDALSHSPSVPQEFAQSGQTGCWFRPASSFYPSSCIVTRWRAA